jgi:phage terminase large subunit-like protein
VKSIDPITESWIRNESDRHAVANGCRFDQDRGEHVIEFIEHHLVLYEGEYAGRPVVLMPWQRDFLMRLFGWVRYSDDWGREIRRFRKASLWLPKKSGKSPLAAMTGLYLLVGDGEQGQKVFSAAKDGRQAQIVHTHARMMTERSPALMRQCTVNRSTGRITHVKTSSFYDVLGADNVAGQEGLNGSVIIDETHVVDSRLAAVLEYVGASRSEPIQLEVSTAGSNPEGYGKRQWDYGAAVERGDVPDDAFLYVAHAAPQDASDEDCSDPAVWQMANPSWGEIIKPEEFRQSFERAKKSLSDFASFKMYRLNVWQKAANVWLRAADWQKCRRDFTPEDLHGKTCWAGLDLSRTRDMSSLVLVFQGDEDDSFFVLPYFWLPKNRATEQSHLARYLDWAHAGKLNLIAGDTIDNRRIFDDVAELARDFNIAEVIYDQTFAEELTGRIEEELGIERVAFRQTVMEFAAPTADFERLVIAGRLHHNGHPVLTWQAGHVEVKSDANGNKRPVKQNQNRGDHRTIDGIVAAIMALARASCAEPTGSVYDTPGSLGLYEY